VAYLQKALIEYPSNLISYRDLAGAFSCKVDSIEFHINRLHTQVRPNGRPQLLTPEAHLTIKNS
jgi:hypothetical protein